MLTLDKILLTYRNGETIPQISTNHFKQLYKELKDKYNIGGVVILGVQGHKDFDDLMKITLMTNGFDVKDSSRFLDVWYA